MKKNHSEEYYDFFLELPPSDYLNDIEIQDAYETPGDSAGLSTEQVSQIAVDSLRDAAANPQPQPADQSSQTSLLNE